MKFEDSEFYDYEELCWLGVNADPESIRYVPEIHLSRRICERAVRYDGSLLQYAKIRKFNRADYVNEMSDIRRNK